MLTLVRRSDLCGEFLTLIELLDKELRSLYGEMQDEYDGFNKLDSICNFVIAYEDDEAVGCGAFKFYEEGTAEIKRMFVKKEHRGKRISRKILAELELWSKQSGYKRAILETGTKQTEAMGLYKNAGYNKIDNYGQYTDKLYSYCMIKEL